MRLIHVVIRCCLAFRCDMYQVCKIVKAAFGGIRPGTFRETNLSVNPKQSLILPGVVCGVVRGVVPGVVPWVVSVVVPEGKMKCYILK